MNNLTKTQLDLIDKKTIEQLVEQDRIEDIKKICFACGKNNTSTINTEGLTALEIEMGAEYTEFYNNLKD